jgi:hypothetical protein
VSLTRLARAALDDLLREVFQPAQPETADVGDDQEHGAAPASARNRSKGDTSGGHKRRRRGEADDVDDTRSEDSFFTDVTRGVVCLACCWCGVFGVVFVSASFLTTVVCTGRFVVIRGCVKDGDVARNFLLAKINRCDPESPLPVYVHWHYPSLPDDIRASKWLPVMAPGKGRKPHTQRIALESVCLVFDMPDEGILSDDVIALMNDEGLLS